MKTKTVKERQQRLRLDLFEAWLCATGHMPCSLAISCGAKQQRVEQRQRVVRGNEPNGKTLESSGGLGGLGLGWVGPPKNIHGKKHEAPLVAAKNYGVGYNL